MNKQLWVLILFCLKYCKKECASSFWARVSPERNHLWFSCSASLLTEGVSSQYLTHSYFSEILYSNRRTSARDTKNLGCTDWNSACEGSSLRNVVVVPIISNTLWPYGLQHTSFPVPHHLLKFTQVHIRYFGDAIQPSHPLMPSSPSALNLSQHQRLFQWVSCSNQITKILEFQLQHQSFQWVFEVDFP